MSQSGMLRVSQGSLPPEVVTSFVTDSGTAVPVAHVIDIFANHGSANAGASVLFLGSGNEIDLQLTDGTNNTFLGMDCGTTANGNLQNTGVGWHCLDSGTNNLQNSCFGYNSGHLMVNAIGNSGFGISTLNQLINGSNNVALGQLSGSHYIGSESSNICIGNVGSVGESHVIRLGSQGSLATQQNKCFIAGIVGVTASNAQLVTINSSTTQMGVASSTPIIAWTDESSDFSPTAGNGYFVTTTCTASLAASPSQGDTISFVVDSSTGVLTIKANTGQFIRLGTSTTIAAGTAKNTTITGYGNTITLVYRSSDTTWWALNSTGTWTLT